MSDFTLFKRGECPICSGASKGCRESNTTGLMFCRNHSANPNDYIYRGEDVHGFGLWQAVEDASEFSQQAREERSRQRREFLDAQERRKQQQIAHQLPEVDRDKAYRRVLGQLFLTESDRQNLLGRGLTSEQIKRDGYRSVKQWQQIHDNLPHNLPGILRQGFSKTVLNIPGDGILCPIFNLNGLIVGCQIRLHDGTDGRYRWLSSAIAKNPDGASPHVDGELPLGIYEPDSYLHPSIWLCEGTGIKPSITRYQLGVPVIGAAGGRFDSSPETAKAAIEYLSAKYQTKILTFAIDAGDVVNTDGVPQRWQKQFEFFSPLGYQCRVAWWGQVTKDSNDIDELADTSIISYITPEDFWSIVEENKAEKTATEAKPETKKLSLNWAWDNWRKSRNFTPDIKLDQEQLKLPKIPKANAIIAINSGLGTGKTKALLSEIKQSENRAMLEGYRNNLLFQTIKRGEEIGVTIYHLREDDGKLMLGDNSSHLAFCLDSIPHVDGYFEGSDIYLDETCSVLLHAVNGGTLGDNQAKVIKIFTLALQECNRVFLLDGNLSDLYVDFIAKLAPNKRVIKIKNERKIKSHDIIFVEGIDTEGEIKKGDRSPLIKELLNPDVIPWIFSDSKQNTKILEKLLTDFRKRGYVLNSETAGEDWAKEFLADPDKFILDKKPDFICISPTAESGVSVTVNNYFTHKFSFFVGVQGTNSQHQAMFRLRDNSIPHYVFCPERSTVKDRSTPHTYSAKKFEQEMNERIMQSGFLASQCSENPTCATEVINQARTRQNDHWWEFSIKLGALDNFEMNNLRKCLTHSLEEAGHDVSGEEWDVDEYFRNLQKQAKQKVQQQHAKELYEAVEYESVDEARKIAKSNPRKPTQRRIEKTFFLDKLPGIKDNKIYGEEFIYECYIKNKHFITQQQRYWFLKNFEISQKRHEVAWYYQATKEDFFSARVKRMPHDVIWALKELDILQFEKLDEYTKNTEEVVNFVKRLRERKDIQLALNISLEPETETGDERIRILASLLNLIGFKNKFNKQKLVDGIKLRHYTCQPITEKEVKEGEFDFPSARIAVLEAIERKFTEWMQSDKSKVNWEEEQPKQETSEVTENNLLTINQASTSTEIPNMNVADDEELWTPEAIATSIEECVNVLAKCEDVEELGLLRQIYPKKALKIAAKQLEPDVRTRVKQWILELNAA